MTKQHAPSSSHLRTSLGDHLSHDRLAEMEAARDSLPTVPINVNPNENPVKVFAYVYEDLVTGGVFFTQPTLGVVRKQAEQPARFLGGAVVAADAIKGHAGDPARPDLIVELLPTRRSFERNTVNSWAP